MSKAPSLWQEATVVAVHDIADRIRRIELAPAHPVRARAGEHIDVRLPLAAGREVRSYSVVDSDPDGRRLAISVLQTRDSKGGSRFMHQVAVGDILAVTQPLQDFPLRVGARRYVLLAGGIGVTALVGMAEVLRRVRADYRIVYVGRRREAMAYLDALGDAHGDRLAVHVDAEGAGLDVDALLDGIEPGTELYMCGPIRLMDAVRRGWLARGLDITDLRFETVGNSGWFEPEEFTVEVPRLGVTTTVGTGESMLEALERAGVEMMFDCRKGECGLCAVTVRELVGKPDHRDVFLSQAQKEEVPARTLTCCVSRVAGAGGVPPRVALDVT